MRQIKNKQHWDKIVKSFPYYDPAHLWGYFAAFQTKMPDAEPILFHLATDYGEIAYPFFKSQNDQGEWILSTVYGYTGPLMNVEERSPLIVAFQKEFHAYCVREKIKEVKESFHPVFENAIQSLPDSCIYKRRDVILAEPKAEMELLSNYQKKLRRDILKAQKEVVIKREGADQTQNFLIHYIQTMKNKQADSIYYFEPEFFEVLFEELDEQAQFFNAYDEGELINSTLVLYSPYCAFIFLIATNFPKRHLAGGSLVNHEMLKWFFQQKIPVINFGGGYTLTDDDPLLLFKKKFANAAPVPFYNSRTTLD